MVDGKGIIVKEDMFNSTTPDAVVVFEPREGRVLGDDKNVSEKKRGRVLLRALDIINGQRQQQYGNPEDSFPEIAHLWNWWLGSRLNAPLTAQDVAMMMTAMKLAREKNGAGKSDNVADACGYLGLYEDMRGRTK